MDRQILLTICSFTLLAAVLLFFALMMRGACRYQAARYAIAGAFHPESDARGLELLKEWLSPEQLTCYKQNRYFDVIGSDSATVFRVHQGTQTNIEELDGIGRPVCRWCFVPKGDLVAGDVMLAQKIALETNERGALAVANRSRGAL